VPVHPVERKLAAILAADVVGYSRLMGGDEAGTLARLKEHRRGLIDPKISEHKGRIVKTTGDGILIEFPSVVEAVACAVAVQRGMTERNAATPEEQRIVFRAGVNLGDIIIADHDIHGDGVNVAARLEGIAEPGGICVSAIVHDQVRDKLDLAFEDLGEQALKNITRPVREAMRASPHDPLTWLWTLWSGVIQFNSRNFDAALEMFNQLARLRPEIGHARGMIAGSLAFLGHLNEACEVLERLGSQPLDPRYQQRPPWLRPEDYALRMEGWRLALGETP
jgi:class 3 adenylate cyclase